MMSKQQTITTTDAQLPTIDEDKSLSQHHLEQTNISAAAAASEANQLKLPFLDLFKGPREEYLKIGVPLYEASIRCDWKAAKPIFEKYEEMGIVKYSITENGETALHVAASAETPKHVQEFVENLVGLMENDDLALQNKNHNTALYLAAIAGNVEAVKIMLEKNKDLIKIPGGGGKMMPLYAAALFGHHKVVKYLYENSTDLCKEDGWTPENRGWLLEKCVENDMFDIALKIVGKYPELAYNGSVLRVLARKPKAFSETKTNSIRRIISRVFAFIGSKGVTLEKESDALKLLKIVWDDIAKKPKNEIDDILRGELVTKVIKPTTNVPAVTKRYRDRIIFIAAQTGNTRFLVELIRQYPDLIWKVNHKNRSIFHTAVKHRHEGIYNLLYEIGAMKDLITPLKDPKDNVMLHLVGKIAKQKRLEDVSGVALQMQRELLWFKEVERMIPPSYRERKNKNGLTPHELFTKEHKDLLTLGEKWMKGTANQCMVVAALIATIVFAAAFTVPGGYNQDNGIPMFYSKATFMVFVVADAISLFSSSASILIFLSILTSRYAERDFLSSLPKKLMSGLAALFLSITTMTVAFSVSFFVLYHEGLIWMPILIAVFALMPVLLYMLLQYGLFFDVFRSTYRSRYLFKPQKHVLYYENPKV